MKWKHAALLPATTAAAMHRRRCLSLSLPTAPAALFKHRLSFLMSHDCLLLCLLTRAMEVSPPRLPLVSPTSRHFDCVASLSAPNKRSIYLITRHCLLRESMERVDSAPHVCTLMLEPSCEETRLSPEYFPAQAFSDETTKTEETIEEECVTHATVSHAHTRTYTAFSSDSQEAHQFCGTCASTKERERPHGESRQPLPSFPVVIASLGRHYCCRVSSGDAAGDAQSSPSPATIVSCR